MSGSRSHFYSAVLGGLVVAIVIAVLPAVATNGDNMIIGQKNTAVTVTRLNTRGGLRIDNFKAGNPALILNTVGTTPPMQISSTGLVDNLNADLLDGVEAADLLDKATYDTGDDGKVDHAERSDKLGSLTASDVVQTGVRCPPGAVLEGVSEAGAPLCSPDATGRVIDVIQAGPPQIGSSLYSDFVLDGDGFPVVAYWERYVAVGGLSPGRLMLIRCDDPNCAGTEIARVLDDDYDSNYWRGGVSIALQGDLPVVAYTKWGDVGGGVYEGDLMVAACTDVDCNPANGTVNLHAIDTTGNVGIDPEIGVDAENRVVIAYRDETNDMLKVARCSTSCATVDSAVAVEAGGFSPSMVFDPNWPWHPIIAHYDTGEQQVELTSCATAGCTGATNTEPVASAGTSVYTAVSLTLTPSGLRVPVIAYTNPTDGDLFVVECVNRTCQTAGDPHQVNDDAITVNGDVGVAVVPGASTGTVVVYIDSVRNDLVIAHCADTDCSGTSGPTIHRVAGGADWMTHLGWTLAPDGTFLVTSAGGLAPAISGYRE